VQENSEGSNYEIQNLRMNYKLVESHSTGKAAMKKYKKLTPRRAGCNPYAKFRIDYETRLRWNSRN
jgi:hypothetical protein